MARSGFALGVGVTSLIVAIGTAGWTLRAQDRGRVPKGRETTKAVPGEPSPEANSALKGRALARSVQDALLQPFDLPFARETTLDEVVDHLHRALNAPVVLDLGALDRLELTPQDTVQLDLRGVRLKTGLKILLDQVGMTYRVFPEDNLLLLTDALEADDRYARILDEIRSLHRDVHDLQDAVDELFEEEPDESGTGRFLHIGRPSRRRLDL